LHDALLIALAMGVHPDFTIVLAQIAEKTKRRFGEGGFYGRHVLSL
jgi:hypothetical protein